MAINANREQARLTKSQDLLKKAEGEDLARLAIIVQKQTEALESKEKTYPQKLKRHLRKCKKYGWTDARLGNKKK